MGDGSSQLPEAGGKVAFVILCQGHSGTTLLASLLDSHPAITCFDELFNDNSNHERAFRRSGFASVIRRICPSRSIRRPAMR